MKHAGRHRRRRGQSAGVVVGAVIVIALAVVVVWLVLRGVRREGVVAPGGASAGAGGAVATAPQTRGRARSRGRGAATSDAEVVAALDSCPPTGDGGDRALNLLKNRVDAGRWQDVPLDSLLSLGWPHGIEDRQRSRWPAAALRVVSPEERRAVRAEGYLVKARLSGPEATNCHGEDPRLRDYHLWLTQAPGIGRENSLIAEMTPRLRLRHPAWTLRRLAGVTRRGERVRVAGWLLLDQEHPEQLGRTRGTLWEIHPVSGFEVQRRGRWIPLDSLTDTGGRR